MRGKTNLFLIGPMGSGKTAVGRQLARVMERPFYDSDAEIERRTGVDIPYIFEREGEMGFRQREREAIECLTQIEGIVLATGGGAILLADNRRCLAERGYVVYLETSAEQQADRVKQGRVRPLISDAADPLEKLKQLIGQRGPLYREIADLIVCTDCRKVRAVADEILRELDAAGPKG